MYLLQKASFGRKILKNPQTGKKFVLPSNKYFKTKTTKEGVVFYAGENPITDPVCEVKIDSSDILTCREKSGLSVKINPSNGNYTPKYDFEISSRFNYGFGYLVTKTGEMHKFHFNNLNHFQTDMSLVSSKNIKCLRLNHIQEYCKILLIYHHLSFQQVPLQLPVDLHLNFLCHLR